MSEDLRSAVQMLAADNARLCDRLITAEAVVSYARKFLETTSGGYDHLRALVAKHDAGRPS
jgi:hypothetical protein